MIGAVVRHDIVENIIVIKEDNIESMTTALKCEIVDARPFQLQIGDLRTAIGWTRNAGGEQVLLPEVDPDKYDTYTLQQEQIVKLEGAVEAANETAKEAGSVAVAETMEVLGLE